ncbi:MAG: hypothetical protein CVU86_07045 [Firmicutes bacterium HGW-Firmicutes-11]|jgi:Holliday junction resolvase|nr:MAG: hypothetical protein CVU94_00760 [Firmicutes bacterium HGW-Firmicutes-19]PKM84481.1 MAG: hypothetical protein CVU86_07045 [Firmicutes bacterium HGW-Firmicutes-11]
MRESSIERKLVQGIKKAGGLCMKFTSPGRRGVPDRIILINGKILFVELKAPGGELSELQRVMISNMRFNGARVEIIDSAEKVYRLLEELT